MLRTVAPYLQAAAGVLGLALSVASVVSAHSPPTFSLRVYDGASLSAATWADLRSTFDRALSTTGIAVEWDVCGDINRPCPALAPRADAIVRIVDSHPGMAPNHCGFALANLRDGGFISLSVSCASRALDRMARRVMSPVIRVRLGELLGYTLAHELAHLLLPGQAHSEEGIFAGHLDRRHLTHAVEGTLAFMPADVQRLRAAATTIAAAR